MGLYVGLALMAVGVVLLFVGRSKSKSVRVEANGNSIAVGGKNTGSITNTNIGTPPASVHSSHWLSKVAIGVEMVGIAVTLWHAWHLAAK